MMNIFDAIERRHSVRKFTDRPIDRMTIEQLQIDIDRCNQAGELNMQLIIDEPDAFKGFMASYGMLKNVRNYLAIVGEKSDRLEEVAGYYGEQIVLKATMLGLDSCWVAATFSKRKARYQLEDNQKFVCLIALGYGENHGVPSKSKSMDALCKVDGEMPDWFKKGMQAAMLAPTAINQQKFMFTLVKDQVTVRATGGFYSNIDLGIVKYHFEVGSGRCITDYA